MVTWQFLCANKIALATCSTAMALTILHALPCHREALLWTSSTSNMGLPTYSSYADEKLLARQHDQPSPLGQRSRPSSRRRVVGHFIPSLFLFCAVLFLFRSAFVIHNRCGTSKDLAGAEISRIRQGIAEPRKVELEAHIMSKCPDARDCLQQLVVPAMVQISEKVDFKLSYIGKLV